MSGTDDTTGLRPLSLEVGADWKHELDAKAANRGVSTAAYVRMAIRAIPSVKYGLAPTETTDAQLLDYRYYGIMETAIQKMTKARNTIDERLDGYGVSHEKADEKIDSLLQQTMEIKRLIEDDANDAYVPAAGDADGARSQMRIRVTENNMRALDAFCQAMGVVTGKPVTNRYAIDLAVWCMEHGKTRLTGSWAMKSVLHTSLVADEMAEAAGNSIEKIGHENYARIVDLRADEGRDAISRLSERIIDSPATAIVR